MTDWKRQCAAVMPCFNEAGRIAPLIAGVRRHLSRVIVVDDGSGDATAEEAAQAGAEVIRRTTNGGKGTALRTGWTHARQAGFTWVLCMDGDGQHAPSDIPKFFERAENNTAALLVGDRMGDCAAMPWLRQQANRWMTRQLSAMAGVRLADSQCGFRLARLDALLGLKLSSRRFEIESEMLLAFLAAGLRVEFVPIQVIYESARSNICPFLDTWRWLRWLAEQQPAR